MDPIYKPPSSLDVTKLAPRKPYPSGGMDTNVPTTSGQSPCNTQPKPGHLQRPKLDEYLLFCSSHLSRSL